MNLPEVLQRLSIKRPVFHSEADFQFALAWEIKQTHPEADVRLEVPCGTSVNGHIDMVVRTPDGLIPMELKYLKKKLDVVYRQERYKLPEGVHDIDMYHCIKDLARLETFKAELEGCLAGYAVWLTNDPAYWDPAYPASYYQAFHAPQNAVKQGTLAFVAGSKIMSQKGLDKPVELHGCYAIGWTPYSDLGLKNGILKAAVIAV